MFLQIVTPEQVLFSGEVNEVAVPGINGEFQMLNHHAPIVSVLQKGSIKLASDVQIPENVQDQFQQERGKQVFHIDSGVIESKNNEVTILVD